MNACQPKIPPSSTRDDDEHDHERLDHRPERAGLPSSAIRIHMLTGSLREAVELAATSVRFHQPPPSA